MKMTPPALFRDKVYSVELICMIRWHHHSHYRIVW
jgi:hypothetical protein